MPVLFPLKILLVFDLPQIDLFNKFKFSCSVIIFRFDSIVLGVAGTLVFIVLLTQQTKGSLPYNRYKAL